MQLCCVNCLSLEGRYLFHSTGGGGGETITSFLDKLEMLIAQNRCVCVLLLGLRGLGVVWLRWIELEFL